MNIIKKVIIFFLFFEALFSIHGKIVFYDGAYVVGKVKKIDESSVYIIPIGLDTAEGVLIGNIDSLKMENGMVPVLNSSVIYFYQNGEFLRNDDDWMDQNNEFKYDDYTSLQNSYKYEEIKKTHQQYYQVSAFGALPIFTAVSLQEDDGTDKLSMNLGGSFQFPYFPIGALDISPGFRFMSYGFEASHQGKVQAINLSAFSSFDFKPVFYFIPDAFHLSLDFGVTYNSAYDLDQNVTNFPAVERENLTGNDNYSGTGFYLGFSADYWMKELPLAFRFFLNNNVIPQAPPFTAESTFFSNIGLSVIIVLKRFHSNNLN
jgi:hypothetical protein